MKGFFYNEWTITVIGGLVLTGILQIIKFGYTLFTGKQNVKKANEYVNELLEKAMTNGTPLSKNLLDAFLSTSVRKFNVNGNKIFKEGEFIDDIIARTYETDHLSVENKNLNIQNLLEFKQAISVNSIKYYPEEIKSSEQIRREEKSVYAMRNLIRSFLPMYFVVMTFLLLATLIYSRLDSSDYFFTKIESDNLFIALLIYILVILIVLYVYILLRFKRKIKK
ncbi:hypothetical protein EY688_08855 [Enterococcus casseliflavus]|uniref:hypothetical protein n=1 Tax=Enterococcus casseliflavus TaxID=37734 RepID=UPI001AD76AE4|nr:hypothetical protein [Enterococcus casseliflavus]MBO6349282.1 hypothetical protein [Enterococcus casseliflavus]MBO6367610.1 hypothetical protein [Enterococcus casseliflavus]